MSYAVKVENLKKSYGDHTVLKGLSFHVKKGEVFALLGGCLLYTSDAADEL